MIIIVIITVTMYIVLATNVYNWQPKMTIIILYYSLSKIFFKIFKFPL